jgi:hypothetical protein
MEEAITIEEIIGRHKELWEMEFGEVLKIMPVTFAREIAQILNDEGSIKIIMKELKTNPIIISSKDKTMQLNIKTVSDLRQLQEFVKTK